LYRTLGIIAVWLGLLAPAAAETWGPDEFGYVARSAESGGEPFVWEELLGSGNVVWQNQTHNNYWLPEALPIGFNFFLYDTVFTTFYISTDGFINLGSRHGNPYCPLPTENRGYPLRVMNRSLFLTAGESVVLYQTLPDPLRCIVEFYRLDNEWPRGIFQTFEIILYESGRVKYQYLDVDSMAESVENCGIDDPDAYGLSIGRQRHDGEAVTFDLQGRGSLQGVVTDLATASPLPGVTLRILNTTYQTTTDTLGRFSLFQIVAFEYEVEASLAGYNAVSLPVYVPEGDTAHQDFALPHPEIVIDPSSRELELAPGAGTLVNVPLFNPGNGPLEFRVEPAFNRDKSGLRGAGFVWDLLTEINLTLATQDDDCRAAAFDGNYFFVAAGPGETGQRRLYRIDRFAGYSGYFQQPAATWGEGLSDLCYRNNLCWGVQDSLIFSFDSFGTVQDQFTAPASGLTALAVTSDGETFWAADTIGVLHRFNRAGTQHELFSGAPVERLSGLAYDDDSYDGPWIWAWAGEEDSRAFRFDLVAGIWADYAADPPAAPAQAGGCDFTSAYDPSLGALLTVDRTATTDWLRLWEITPADAWLDVYPKEGVVPPGETLQLILDIRLPQSAQQGEIWSADLVIENNSSWNPASFSLIVHAEPDAGLSRDERGLIPEFRITASPNPANRSFTLTLPDDLILTESIAIYTVRAELVLKLPVHNDEARLRKITVNTDGMSSGVYIYTLRSGSGFYSGKVCVLK
jgi:hypothetical protein